MTKLTVGSYWYVKLPKKSFISKVMIVEVTVQTVLLDVVDNELVSLGLFQGTQERYKTDDVEFVEKLNVTAGPTVKQLNEKSELPKNPYQG